MFSIQFPQYFISIFYARSFYAYHTHGPLRSNVISCFHFIIGIILPDHAFFLYDCNPGSDGFHCTVKHLQLKKPNG